MSVNDDAELPWLADEKRSIADAVRGGCPYWGACLGVQLLAASLGARVYTGEAPEVGLLPVELTDEALADPVFGGLPRRNPHASVARRHVRPPRGRGSPRGLSRVSEPGVPVRADAYGVQFHLEVIAEMAREWAAVPAYAGSLERVLGPVASVG